VATVHHTRTHARTHAHTHSLVITYIHCALNLTWEVADRLQVKQVCFIGSRHAGNKLYKDLK